MNTATSQPLFATPVPPGEDAQALVPKDAEQSEYKPLIENQHFTAFLNKLADFATAQSNSPQQWERRRKTVRMRKFLCGEYYGIVDKTRGWVRGDHEGDGVYYNPQAATFLETLLASLIKTRPQKKCEARQSDNIAQREAARVAESLLTRDDEKNFTPKKHQREWKWNLLPAGETYRITYFNPGKEGYGVKEEVLEPKIIKGGDKASWCPLCSSTATDETGKCAKCGNPQMDEVEALGTEITVNKGYKYKQIGDSDFDIPDALEMTVLGDTDSIGEALIVMRERMIPRCVLEDALEIDNLPSTGTPESLQYRQLFTDQSEDPSVREFELLHYQEFWFAPAVYTSYKFPAATTTQSGETVPAGTKGKDVFPQGFYFSRVKKRVCTLFPQPAGEVLSHAANSLGEGFHGQGEWDLIELQDQATEAHSMKMNSMLMDSTSPLLVRAGIIDPENFENKFGLVLTVPEEAYDEKHGLDGAMKRVPLSSPPQEAYQVGEELKGMMQQRVGAFSTQSDAPDIKAMGTATGIAALTENTLGRRVPALQLYAQMEIEQAYQKLEMRQKYWCRKMYQNVAQDLGDDAVKWFMQCNIRQDIDISVVQNSWMPKTEGQKRADFQEFFALTSELMMAVGDKDMMDEVLRKANEIFGGGIDFNDLKTNQTEAQLRLDNLRDVGTYIENQFGEMLFDEAGNINPQATEIAYLQTAEMLRIAHQPQTTIGPDGIPVPDPLDLFYALPMIVMLDAHPEFFEVYSDWLKSAEGRAASTFIRTLVHDLTDFHLQAEGYRQMKLKQYQMVAMAPEVQAEQALSEMDAAKAEEQNVAMQAQEEGKAGADVDNQRQDAEAQRMHEKEMKAADLEDKELDRQHQIELKKMEAANANRGE